MKILFNVLLLVALLLLVSLPVFAVTTPTPTRGWRWVDEWTRTPYVCCTTPDPHHTPFVGTPGPPVTWTPRPTANWIEYDTAYTPTRGFTPRITALPGTVPPLTPFVNGMSYAKRDHYATPWWTPGAVVPYGYSYNAVAVTAGTATRTRSNTAVPTFTRTGVTRTPTPPGGGGGGCLSPGGFETCTPSPRPGVSPTRTPTPPPQGRFLITVDWATATSSGRGALVPIAADAGSNTAGVWFFSAGNYELMLKLLVGCSTNGQYWFFAGGLTNVKVTIVVKDNLTGATKTYTNPLNNPFAPIQDTAFEPCQ